MKLFALLALTALLFVGNANAQGLWPGLPSASLPLVGTEKIPADTNLSGGRSPQTEAITVQQLQTLRSNALTNATTATVPVNLATTSLFNVTLAQNGGIAAPTNATAGSVFTILVTQNATGGFTLAWDPAYKWTGATTPTTSVTAGRTSRFDFVSNGTNYYGIATLNYF
jgi:hypothetical protein